MLSTAGNIHQHLFFRIGKSQLFPGNPFDILLFGAVRKNPFQLFIGNALLLILLFLFDQGEDEELLMALGLLFLL